MKKLTKAEEQVMQALWSAGRGFVREVIDRLPPPKPAYNTVSTIIRILERKGFVSHKSFGKSYEYYPLVQKHEYSRKYLKYFMKNYFRDSFQDMVSFFAQEENLSIGELDKVLKAITSIKDKKKRK